MKLSEIFQYLKGSEFSQLSIGGGAAGVIRPEDYPKVAQSINLGLINLYTRFSLKEGVLKLVLDPAITHYVLTKEHCLSTGSGSGKYIDDIASPFLADIAKIQGITTEFRDAVPLNKTDDAYSCLMLSTSTLDVPYSIVVQSSDLPEQYKTSYLNLHYRALHPNIDVGDSANLDPSALEIELPYPFLEPLLYFVAARMHHPSSLNSEVNPATSYYSKYEQSCKRLENSDLDLDKEEGTSKFRLRGWV